MADGPVLMRPIAEPMRLAAREAADLVQLSDGLQIVIARLAACEGLPSAELVMEGQAADLLSQRLAGLAAFLDALADAAPEDARTDVRAAVDGLLLAEQARKLSGPAAAFEPFETADVDAGDLCLFED